MNAGLPLRSVPIDDRALDGRPQLVLEEGSRFALARWDGARWLLGNDRPYKLNPTHYVPREAANG